MSVVKVKIDARAGLIELEGDNNFVGSYLEKLIPLVESIAKRQTLDVGHAEDSKIEDEDENVSLKASPAIEIQPKKARRSVRPPPVGASCRSRINTLRENGYFKVHRTMSDVVGGLKEIGFTHTLNQVGASLSQMHAKGEIQRTNSSGSKKGWSYFWDRG